MSFFSFLIAVLPVILIGLYIYKKDNNKESTKFLFKLFVGGVVSCIPAVILGLIVSSFFPSEEDMNFIQMLLYVFIAIAMVEELCKWYFVNKISYNHDEFDTIYDMVVYASFTALGFACFENILYVSTSGIMIGIVRAISAVPGHVCDGILMGSYLGLAKINHVKGNLALSNRYKILSIVIPIITHGIYDFCLFWESNVLIFVFLIFVITLYIICVRKVRKISKNDIKFKYRDNYCAICGFPVNSDFCPRCGRKNE